MTVRAQQDVAMATCVVQCYIARVHAYSSVQCGNPQSDTRIYTYTVYMYTCIYKYTYTVYTYNVYIYEYCINVYCIQPSKPYLHGYHGEPPAPPPPRPAPRPHPLPHPGAIITIYYIYRYTIELYYFQILFVKLIFPIQFFNLILQFISLILIYQYC